MCDVSTLHPRFAQLYSIVDTPCEYICTYNVINKLFCKLAVATHALTSTTGMEYPLEMHGSGVPDILGNLD
jgi:hypothetical protein